MPECSPRIAQSEQCPFGSTCTRAAIRSNPYFRLCTQPATLAGKRTPHTGRKRTLNSKTRSRQQALENDNTCMDTEGIGISIVLLLRNFCCCCCSRHVVAAVQRRKKNCAMYLCCHITTLKKTSCFSDCVVDVVAVKNYQCKRKKEELLLLLSVVKGHGPWCGF